MTEAELPGNDPSMTEFFGGIAQGTLLQLPDAISAQLHLPEPYFGSDVIVVSQTCDVVLAKRPSLHVAPLVAVDPSEARPENPRYLTPPNADGLYADLAWITPIDKALVTSASVGPAIDDHTAARDFALGVARWFGRYPFTDEVAEWLRPLLSVIRKKYAREQSPLGIVMQHVAELRVTLSDWGGGPADVTLHVIAKAGSIPEFEDPPTLDAPTRSALFDASDTLRPLSHVAGALAAAMDSDRIAAAACWGHFADALARECKLTGPHANDRSYLDAVTSVVAELDSEDTFPLRSVRKSEVLDLEYLSSSGLP